MAKLFDRILFWWVGKRGYTLMRCVEQPRPTGWYYPPLREPTVRFSWSDPDVSVSRAYECPSPPAWWSDPDVR